MSKNITVTKHTFVHSQNDTEIIAYIVIIYSVRLRLHTGKWTEISRYWRHHGPDGDPTDSYSGNPQIWDQTWEKISEDDLIAMANIH